MHSPQSKFLERLRNDIPKKVFSLKDSRKGSYDVSPSVYLELETIVISFGDYRDDPLYLKWSTDTQELFMGSINDGGHAPRFRVMRIDRSDVYESSGKLLALVENRSYEMWCGTASKAEKTNT